MTVLPHSHPPLEPGDDPAETGHQVEVVLRLSNRQMGVRKEREQLFALQDRLSDLLDRTGTGELEGDEYGAGLCTLFFTGPDGDRLLATVLPHLQESGLCRGGHAIVRYGTGPAAPQERVRL